MYKSLKSRLTAVASVVALSMAFAAPAQAQNEAGDSLVNVQVAGLNVLVPVSVAANLCDVNANILAAQAREGGATCTADATSTASPAPSEGGGNEAGGSLVNVQLADTTVAIPISAAANICDVNVNALLAEQVRSGGATCEATSNSETS